MTQMQDRFADSNLDIMDAVYGLPRNVVTKKDWKTHFTRFLETYKDDLPNPRFLETELESWSETCLRNKDVLPSKLTETLEFIDEYTFPNILTAFQIFATIPVTRCECERSISGLRRLKSYLCSKMGEKRLNGLALLNAHRKYRPDTDAVINRFATKHRRRMALADIFNDD
jgi:hypothetical protein